MSRSDAVPGGLGPPGRSEHDAAPDGELAVRHLAGEGAAFEALYRRHAPGLYRTALAMTHRPMVAEELLQEAFLRAYRHLGAVRIAPEASLRPWLHRILVNLIYDHWARRQARAGALEAPIERWVDRAQASPERRAEAGDVAGAVEAALASLPFKQRLVATLFYLQDMDVEEIAEVLAIPEGTVKSRLFYGRAGLRRALAADRRVALDPALRGSVA